MKASVKNVAIALSILAMILVVLTAVDKAGDMSVSTSNTAIRVTVVDLDNNPVHNAEVSVCGQQFYCDNNGNSPIIQLENLSNSYDASINAWYTATITICKSGYVATVVLNCVIFQNETRKLTVKIYPQDDSSLPYVCYVETPPDEYVKQLLNK